MICPNCGKGTIGRYATDNSLCGECSDNSSDTDSLSVEKLQEQLNTAKKALAEIINANDNLFLSVHGRGDLDSALDNARKALAAIGGDDE
ncbi:hypothetical protein QK916_03355 [Lactococcus lactis]|uniref:hypothetical protein n=1 Tax=Lactococcus lactis TaxID=1358 RepID=UPI00325D7CB5